MTNLTISNHLFNSLKMKYESDIQSAITTLHIYFKNCVGIGEHPQHLEEMDKLLEKISSAEDKLQSLNTHFSKDYNVE